MLIECVPNISEGRDIAKVASIAEVLRGIPGLKLLHIDSSADANRTVLTFVGPKEAVLEGAFSLVKACKEKIDMRQHSGAHPRLGACDVLPFVPLTAGGMETCVELSEALAKRVGEELQLPVFLYANSAKISQRKNLAEVRRGEYEGLAVRFKSGEKADFGPSTFVPEFGALICGARDFLLAYNVNLQTKNLAVVKQIATSIRESNTHSAQRLKSCRAIGWLMPELSCAQVSTNLTNFRETGLFEAFSRIKQLANKAGVEVSGSELVGLLPKEALLDAGRKFYRQTTEDPGTLSEEQLLESATKELGLINFNARERVLEFLY